MSLLPIRQARGDRTARAAVKRLVPEPVRQRLRRLAVLARWLARDVPRAPGLELYSRWQDMLNRHALRQRRRDAPGRDEALEPFFPRAIPRTVWIYWAQGEANLPHVVRHCVDSWRRLNPGWTVRLLDDTSLAGLVDLSDLPSGLPRRFAANLLRTRLLAAHGGVWADATVWCHRPLDEWLPLLAMTGCFTFDRPGPDRWVSSWFLAAEPGHPVIVAWAEAFGAYLRRLAGMPDKYFMFFYNLQWRLLRDRRALDAFRRKGGLPAPPTFLMMSALHGRTPVAAVREAIARGLPVSKLSWKSGLPDAAFDRFLAEIAAPTADPAVPVTGGADAPQTGVVAESRLEA